MPQKLTLPSFAKINWDLRILGKRPDGFHEICTIYQTISLHDEIDLLLTDNDISLTCDNPDIPTDGSNLVINAAEALRERYAVKAGAAIHLKKRIPSPGGLGGGSSNAAVTLIGLSRIWNLNTPREVLADIAAKLGSDVPFFLYGGSALGTGRGELVEPIDDKPQEYMIVVTPGCEVPTKDAYASIKASNLTLNDSNRILQICRVNAEFADPGNAALQNDLEKSVLTAYPEIARVKERLLWSGAKRVMLSGSGASVFAVFEKEETRQATLKALDSESTWRKFAVATISREQYREALQLVY
jgi:4-diphosphocytidyl-2-C-methyl-D-erythritol kinase